MRSRCIRNVLCGALAGYRATLVMARATRFCCASSKGHRCARLTAKTGGSLMWFTRPFA